MQKKNEKDFSFFCKYSDKDIRETSRSLFAQLKDKFIPGVFELD